MRRLSFRHRFAKTNHLVSCLELATFLEQLYALKALKNVAFSGNGTGPLEAAVLGHKIDKLSCAEYGVGPNAVKLQSLNLLVNPGELDLERSPEQCVPAPPTRLGA